MAGGDAEDEELTIQEEQLVDDPSGFRMLVACILLNATRGDSVRPMLPELFDRWPTSYDLAGADDDLERLLRPLGLWRQRAEKLRRLAAMWEIDPLVRGPRSWLKVGLYPGCGRYAADSWRIFAEGDLSRRVSPDPNDVALRRRLAELREEAA